MTRILPGWLLITRNSLKCLSSIKRQTCPWGFSSSWRVSQFLLRLAEYLTILQFEDTVLAALSVEIAIELAPITNELTA